jgi:succinate dehydrogenase / fumarate reductase flavoprotein subunit
MKRGDKNMKSLTKTFESDILVIGGGIAGISAAITAKEAAPSLEILIVDKATASKGWAGKSARTAGLLSFVTAEDDAEEFVKYCLDNIGFYLNDQTLLREYAFSSRPIAETLTSWGVDVMRKPDGKLDYAKWPYPFGTGGIDPSMCRQMSAYANKLGVKFLDKVVVVDLLKDECRLAGAVGFSILNGDFHIFRTGSIILANGSQNYDMTPMWCSTGNGIAAAYRAGAEMRNAEFGNMCDFARLDRETGTIYYAAAHTAHDYLFNVKGEHISQKYRPGLHSSMDPIAALAWYQETLAGNGPIFADLEAFKTGSGQFFKHHPKAMERMGNTSVRRHRLKTQRFEVIPGFIGELSCVKVDHQMSTSIPGLFAVGDVSGSGSARAGAVPAPPAKIHGTGILNALFMGMKAGPSTAVYVHALKEWGIKPKVYREQVEELRKKTYMPIKLQSGISPQDIIHRIQETVAPVDYGIIKRGDRIEKALASLIPIQQDLSNMKANDYHELAKCTDAESMVLGAELFHKASLMRTESRGFHYREDYPDMDNEHWLKWIILKNENGKMKVYTEDIPMQKYLYQPNPK